MMIPVSTIVGVSIAVGATFPARAGFGTLLIVTNDTSVIGIAERARSYSDITGVAADWATSSEAYKAAQAYFSQQPKPTSLIIATRYDAAQAAQLRGGSVADTAANLALFTAIADGSFNISIDGVNADVTVVNMTGDATMDEVAATIETAVQAADASAGFTGATVTHDGSRFYINSGTTGAASTISFASAVAPAVGTDISSLLQMQQGEGTKTDGIVAETISASLAAIEQVNDSWYGLMFTKEIRDAAIVNGEDAVEAAAAFIEARRKVFFNTSNDLDVLDSVTTTDIASVLQSQSLNRTMTTFSSYPSEYPSGSIAGRAFTVNFSQPNATITLKFKQMPGITVEDGLTINQKNVLDSKNANALTDIGGSFMFAESYMANGRFFDEVHGLDWLQNAIQTNVFGYLLTRTTKVPYTDKGVAALEQQVIKALDEAVFNGLLAPGETIDGEFLPKGYKTITVPVADVNQSDKEARFYGSLSFIALGAGAIHGVQIDGTFER